MSIWTVSLSVVGAIMLMGTSAAAAPVPASKTRIVILGVSHSGQLVSEDDGPAQLAAFIKRVQPSAVCVERAPDAFAHGDQYEFTYEIQHVIVPLALEKGIPLCPFDWMPPVEDQKLAFGISLDAPPEIRSPMGFQGFLFFPEAKALERDLFEADVPGALKDYIEFASTPSPSARRDFPRRLYLYRTYMQAQLLRAAAKSYRGRTLIAVVGEFHKHDLEGILADDPDVEVVQPSSFGRPSTGEVEQSTTREHLAAILSFNLLGRQAETGNINRAWLGRVLERFERVPTSESKLFRLRYDQVTKRLSPTQAYSGFTSLAKATAPGDAFTWTGVEDRSRVDSYFDPYGNLSVSARARIEAARAIRESRPELADRLVGSVARDLSARQARQLMSYWDREAKRTDRPSAGTP